MPVLNPCQCSYLSKSFGIKCSIQYTKFVTFRVLQRMENTCKRSIFNVQCFRFTEFRLDFTFYHWESIEWLTKWTDWIQVRFEIEVLQVEHATQRKHQFTDCMFETHTHIFEETFFYSLQFPHTSITIQVFR